MHVTVKQLPKSSAELLIELSPEETAPYLRHAAEALSREHKVPGFRPGKLPYEIAVQRFGAMAILEEAAEPAVRDAYVRAVREQGIRAIGSPKIALATLAPENPLRFTATVAVLPNVVLPDFTTIRVKRRTVTITPEEVDRILGDLRKMQPKEALVDRAAGATDKVIVDLDLKRDGVPLEGGQTKDHQVYLGEEYYLPKIREGIVGMVKGETKTFPVEFPADHFQKHLAGTTVDATVTLHDVYSVELPALDDTFAKALGQPDLVALRSLVEKNRAEEATKKASDAEEVEMLDAIIAGAKFDDLPELLVTGEARRMIDELEDGIKRQGLAFNEYLEKIKKTRDQLFLDMAPDAVRRVKAALLTRAVAEAQQIVTDDAAVDAEIQRERERYAHEPDFQQRIQSDEARDYVRTLLRNRAVIAWLRGQVTWGA
ncbi:trigger factor [Candidatus Uhrbacteria bacterium]|nr:trigger factor [Candidatus Uhrbacteria bacterium]